MTGRLFAISLLVTGQVAVSNAQVVLSEIMFNAPNEYYEEFIELYNTSVTQAVNLFGYRLGDQQERDSLRDAGFGFTLAPQEYAVVLDPGYWDHSDIYDDLIPPEALILTIADNAFGAYGLRNDPPDTVILTDASGSVIASFAYTSGNPDGFSEEKILLSGTDEPDNWADGLTYLGTPGFANSVQPPTADLLLTLLCADPAAPPFGEPVSLLAVVKNAGQNAASGEVVFASGEIGGLTPDIILGETAFPLLQPFDSASVSLELDFPGSGPRMIYAWHTAADEHPENDSAQVLLLSGYPPGSVIINEIYPAPGEGECEWIEIYNPGLDDVDLYGFQFSDSDTTDRAAAGNASCLLEPGGYAVLAQDSTIQDLAIPQEVPVMILSDEWRALNNDGDTPTIYDAAGEVQDAVPYSGWNVPYAVSLERIYLDGSSSDPSNWQPSYDPGGSTPGRINSTGVQMTPPETAGGVSFSPDPFDPDRHGALEIEITMPASASAVSVMIYDLRGRRLRTVFDGGFPPSPVLWDGRDDRGRRLVPGLYLMFVEFRSANGDRLEVSKKTLVIAGRF